MPATIYFSGSITGGRADVALYRQLVTHPAELIPRLLESIRRYLR